MRLATFQDDACRPTPAVVAGAELFPLDVAGVLEMLVLLADNRATATELADGAMSGPGRRIADVRLLAPLLPPTIRDFVAFEEHVEGVARSVSGATKESAVVPEWYAAPAFYFGNPYAVVGARDDIPIPPCSHILDFELEVAAIIGRAGRNLTPEQGHQAIIGYTIFNDWSARDLQRAEMRVGLGPAKAKDFATTLGPWVTTADELGDFVDGDGFLALPMTVEVNGVEIGRDLLSNMGWPFGELVAHASRGTWVRPGDVLGSGTCGNGGSLAELWGLRGEQSPPPLQAGDLVTMTVGGLGQISNRVVAGPAVAPVPPARRRPRTRP